tara:strand:- start:311 stop:523 length:213 start_codon:yes stop_codon:yes gene_type:complete
MTQLLHKKDAEGKVAEGDFPMRKNVSYAQREAHIVEIENKLMNKYRQGYSQLHKSLVIRAGQQEFGYGFN